MKQGRIMAPLLVLLLVLAGCGNDGPIRIGFSGQLTGTHADLGVHGRNGAMLAVEHINQKGGVAGRPLELVVRDDRGVPEGAQAADRELIELGVTAIIGHMTSGQSVAALPVTSTANMVLLSPTTSTTVLAGKKDLFFRVQPVIADAAKGLARHAAQRLEKGRLAVIYDTNNAAYASAFLGAFIEMFSSLGGAIVARAAYSSAQSPPFGNLVHDLLTESPEGVLLVTSALDAAFLAQKLREAGSDLPLFSSGWAQTDTLLQNGGFAVEGLELAAHYDPGNTDKDFVTFQTLFKQRFGRAPAFAAAQAYDAMLVLAAALKQTGGRAEGLPEALLSIAEVDGLMGPISLDAYGDVVRDSFLLTVRDGVFVTTSRLSP